MGDRQANAGRGLRAMRGLIGVVLFAACENGAPVNHLVEGGATNATRTRDSAGVEIVENPEFAPDSTSWAIDTVPLVVIGDEARGAAHAFGSVADAVRLSTGQIAVADGRAPEVRLFDSTGEYVRTIGRRGQGPGELNGVLRLSLLADDRIAAISGYQDVPVVALDSTGAHAPLGRLPETVAGDSTQRYSSPTVVGAFGDGSWLALTTRRRARAAPSADWRKPVAQVDTGRFVRADTTGAIVADFGEHVVRRTWRYARPPEPGGRETGVGFGYGSVLLPTTQRAAHGDRFFISFGEQFEVLVFDASGPLQRIIRKQGALQAVPRGWGDSAWQADRRIPAPREVAWIVEVDRPPDPAHAPATDQMLIDRGGNLWVRSTKLGDPRPPTWFVFDTVGVLRHSLRSGLDIRRIDDDRVIAVLRDSLRVERVGVFVLRTRK